MINTDKARILINAQIEVLRKLLEEFDDTNKIEINKMQEKIGQLEDRIKKLEELKNSSPILIPQGWRWDVIYKTGENIKADD